MGKLLVSGRVTDMGVEAKIGGWKTPKSSGKNEAFQISLRNVNIMASQPTPP